jgi:hypothetical protein
MDKRRKNKPARLGVARAAVKVSSELLEEYERRDNAIMGFRNSPGANGGKKKTSLFSLLTL